MLRSHAVLTSHAVLKSGTLDSDLLTTCPRISTVQVETTLPGSDVVPYTHNVRNNRSFRCSASPERSSPSQRSQHSHPPVTLVTRHSTRRHCTMHPSKCSLFYRSTPLSTTIRVLHIARDHLIHKLANDPSMLSILALLVPCDQPSIPRESAHQSRSIFCCSVHVGTIQKKFSMSMVT